MEVTNKKISNKFNNNLIFFSVLLILLIVVCTVQIKAVKQNEHYKKEFELFNHATQLIKEGNFEEANKIISPLTKENPDSYLINWYEAISLSHLGKYKEAEIKFTKVRELRPFIVKNENYLLQAGVNYFYINEKEKAIKYFEECIKINGNPEVTKAAEQNLQLIKES